MYHLLLYCLVAAVEVAAIANRYRSSRVSSHSPSVIGVARLSFLVLAALVRCSFFSLVCRHGKRESVVGGALVGVGGWCLRKQ